MIKPKSYTPVGARIAAMCGQQNAIAAALGLDRSQISRKFHGEVALTVEEVITIANYFKIPVWTFFIEDDIDDEVFADCYRMFRQDAIALDRIIAAYKCHPKNLRKLGEIANKMRREHDREKRKHDNSGG